MFDTISVIGLGYIGLPTAALFASRKVYVVGVDVTEETVDLINKGKTHIVEPALDIVVRSTVHEGFLRAVCVPEPAEAFLIAVPTPFDQETSVAGNNLQLDDFDTHILQLMQVSNRITSEQIAALNYSFSGL